MRTGIHYFKKVQTFYEENANVSSLVTNGLVANTASHYELIANSGATNTHIYWSHGQRFNLSQISNLGEYQALFDQYKLRKVVVKMIPYINSVNAPGGLTYPGDMCPIFHYAIDHDTWTAPPANEAGIGALRERNNYKWHKMDRPLTIVIKPRYQGYAEDNAGNPISATTGRGAWLDMARDEVDHYGLLGVFEGIQSQPANLIFNMRCEVTYYMCFKGVR